MASWMRFSGASGTDLHERRRPVERRNRILDAYRRPVAANNDD